MKTRKYRKYLYWIILPFFAFAGGFVSQVVMPQGITQARAQEQSDPIFLYGPDGQPRLQMGMYSGSGEGGLPLVGLSDNSGHLRMLLRLAGSDEAPVLIMKDKSGRDRIVMGLSLNGGGAPFLSIIDEQGKKETFFGTY